MQADRDFAVATAQRGPAGWVSFFAEDGAMVGGAGEIAGHAAHGRYLTVWRKQADGSWKVTADIGSNAPS